MIKRSPTPLVVNDYQLNPRTYEVTIPNRGKVRLTPVQFELLYCLMSHPDEILSASRLLEEVWGYPENTGSRDLVRVHIKKLRGTVEQDPENPIFIRTISGFGYTVGVEG